MAPEPASAQRPPPREFSIATPADWMVVDLELLGDRAVIGGLVDRRVEEEPALDPFRDDLAELVARSARLGDDAGVMFCATLATARDDGAPILATLTVAAGEQDPPQVEADTAHAQTDTSPRAALVNRIDEPDGSTRYAPASVKLPCGLAGRVEQVDDVMLFSDTSLLCLTVQYILAVPDAPEEFVALTFTTPSLAYRARLTDLFGDIAGTFAWVRPEHGSEDADAAPE